MTSSVPSSPAATAAPASATAAAPASATNTQIAGAAGVSSMTTVNTMQQLKEKSPALYNAMMQGIAESIISQSQAEEARLEKTMKEAREAEEDS